jgi:hypothetical protein
MRGMREILRGSLGCSLSALGSEDRLEAGWRVACGRMMAGRGTVIGYKDGVLRVGVSNSTWLKQMLTMSEMLRGEIERISGVHVSRIHFELTALEKTGIDNGE